MKKNFAFVTILLALLCLAGVLPAQSQTQARFTADKTGGCSPLTVNFTNTSTGVTANTQYRWDFGNGNTSTLQHPAVVFTTEKAYMVTLTVTNGNQSTTQSMTITVYEKPTAAFSTNITKGCLPLAVNLTANATQPGGASIASYHWDFGDGYTSEVSNATTTHTYETKQPATVSLTVKNNYGCATTVVKKDLIQILPRLTADFTADKSVLCQVSDPVQFTNKSHGPGTLSYQWDFGNGQTSTAAHPSPAFNTRGTYTVKLTVNTSDGCTTTKTLTDYLNVANYTTAIDLPPSTCENASATINARCSPQPNNLTWTIDGSQYWGSYSQIQPNFSTAGNHSIKLSATYGTCTQEVTRTFVVNALPNTPDFNITNNNVCGAGPVTFKDLSTDAVRREWDFNYYSWNLNVQSTAQEPTYTYTQNGSYSIALRTYNAAGCSKQIVKQVSLQGPAAQILRLGDNPWGSRADCDSAVVSFKTISQNNLVKYKWIFDNNPLKTSADPEPTYTFKGIGYHQVKLEYETDKGCKGEAWFIDHIKVSTRPKADFLSESGTTICGNTRTFFRSTHPNYTVEQYWYINDVYSGSSYYNAFDYQFNEKGKYTIRLISGEYGCRDTITKVDYINVLPPFPKIAKVENSCVEREKVTFTQTSRYAEKWIWDFGDGQTATLTTDQPTVSHNYTANGEYKVVLTAVNGQCSVRDSMQAYVQLKPQAVFSSPQQAICANEPLTFSISNLPRGVYPGYWVYYYFEKFEYGDGTPFTGYNDSWNNFVDPLPYTGKLTGLDATKNKLRVIVRESYHGCLDTSNYIPLIVKGSIAGYKLLNNDICFNNNTIQIQDTSRTSTGGTIRRWDWDFGDGQQLTTYQSGIVTHRYNNPGTYNVLLKITDDVGCVSSPLQTMQTVRIHGPKADFYTSSTTIPLNATVYFSNNTNDFPNYRSTYQWDFGDGQSATTNSPQHIYPVAGKYTVKLTATDPVTGCRSEATREITVQPGLAYFNFTKSFIGPTNCLPLLTSFAVTTLSTDSLSWDFGDGTTAGDIRYPRHIYEQPGKYIITVTAYGANGLTLKHRDSVTIHPPQVRVSNAVWEGCPGHSVNWNLSGTHTTGYVWDFGDGSTSLAQDGATTHAYPRAGTYNPTLLLKDSNGCVTTAGISNKVIIHPNPTIQVAPATGAACLGQPLQLKASGALTYSWSPAAGLSSTTSDQPMASPAQSTTYQVEGTDIHGCKNSTAYTLTVHQPFTVQLNPQEQLCTGDQLTLRAAGADHYKWINNTSGLSNLQSATPVAQPTATTTYTIVGYDAPGCFTDTAEVLVTVNPRPTVDAGKDISLEVGEKVTLAATGSPDIVRWSWTPPSYLSCTGCPNPVSTPPADMQYTITAINHYGCDASDDMKITMLCDESRVRIPNGITPNGDGNNDRFIVKGISIVRHLIIYNRWGNKVFERQNFIAADPSAGWDGTLNGLPQPTGTYVYYIQLQCPKGDIFTKKGTLMLIR